MKILIIAAAGTASRFNKDTKTPVPKCIYYNEDPKNTILYQIFLKSTGIDKIILIGGYEFALLEDYVNTYLSGHSQKTEIIFNPHFEDYGSGYSLYLGIEASIKYKPCEIIFAEGDLFYNSEDFNKIVTSKNDVITSNTQPIEAQKSVVFYEDIKGNFKYLYDLKHKELRIKEPFCSIHNSAQIWKFTNTKKLFTVNKALSLPQKKGTNLVIIGKYFSQIKSKNISIIAMNTWVNCNTINDYNLIWGIK